MINATEVPTEDRVQIHKYILDPLSTIIKLCSFCWSISRYYKSINSSITIKIDNIFYSKFKDVLSSKNKS